MRITDAALAAIAAPPLEKLKKRLWLQTIVIMALTAILALVLPFARPVLLYYAVKPDKTTKQLIGLTMPNMTNQAVLSWVTTAITEIMTMGFGDFNVRIPQQKWRFTAKGWTSYVQAFVRQEIGKQFRDSQLVLTTAPSNTPVILSQGANEEQVYQWIVQMPVIMTYATNNNVTDKKRGLVTLTIVRVPYEDSAAGIAIKKWTIGVQ